MHGFQSMAICRDAQGHVQWPVLCATTRPAIYILRKKKAVVP